MNKYKPSYAEAPHEIRNWKYGYPQHLFKELESKILNTMNEIKFNSQICTTKEQSQRLLDLGLKPETADMILIHNIFSNTYELLPKASPTDTKCYIPAWSLHRLLEMICNKECEEHYYFDFSMDYDSMADVYDSIIEVIERHIKDNFINKEYLKQ